MDHKFKRSNKNPGALVNTDRNALDSYKLKKSQNLKLNNLENRIENIETMLSLILDKLSKED
jgi:hypothetical protein